MLFPQRLVWFSLITAAALAALLTGCQSDNQTSAPAGFADIDQPDWTGLTNAVPTGLTDIDQPDATSRTTGLERALGHLRGQDATSRTNGLERALLQAGDGVSIRFGYSTNYDTVQKIALDGMLNLPEVGEVLAAGKTQPELQTELKTLFEPFVKDDKVTVTVIAPTAVVYVLGAVLSPGRLPLDHPMTLLEVVAAVGGFDGRRAQLSAVAVFRVVDGKQERFTFDLNQVMTGKQNTMFMVKPFDIVYVPPRKFNF